MPSEFRRLLSMRQASLPFLQHPRGSHSRSASRVPVSGATGMVSLSKPLFQQRISLDVNCIFGTINKTYPSHRRLVASNRSRRSTRIPSASLFFYGFFRPDARSPCYLFAHIRGWYGVIARLRNAHWATPPNNCIPCASAKRGIKSMNRRYIGRYVFLREGLSAQYTLVCLGRTLEELLYLLVFVWSLGSERWPVEGL